MDRRRFEEAHLKFAILQTVAQYQDQFQLNKLPFYSDIKDTLEHFTPVYYQYFQGRYASMSLQMAGQKIG